MAVWIERKLMTNSSKKVSLEFEFVIPSERTSQKAKKHLDSSDTRVQAVAKALIDFAELSTEVKDFLENKTGGDLAPYLDFWFADAVIAAKMLKNSRDEEIRDLATTLIEQEKAAIESKEFLLRKMKSLGIRPDRTGF
jgi:hypothetical protein